jgi:CDP-4-dehydro-6-deoxyglucose reductase
MREAGDLYLDETIRAWRGRLAGFNYVPVLSRAGATWSGCRGHVQDAVCADLADLSGHAVYLCGSPNMVREARVRFVARGASADYVYADSFAFQHQEELT